VIGDERVLALVPARGGSRGIPRKNLVEVGGRTLLAWVAEAARGSRVVDRVVLSSEDPEILEAGRRAGLDTPFVRPAELARDDTPGIDPVLHALDALDQAGDHYGWVVLLQPTSPLRTSADIDGTAALCGREGAPAAVSITAADKSPWWMFHLGSGGLMEPLLDAARRPQRRQDAPPVYVLNGAVYVARVEWLRRTRSFLTDETVGYVMPRERSVDVDEPADLHVVEALLAER
jgi:N-acylneuraminate cytidylyltransferase